MRAKIIYFSPPLIMTMCLDSDPVVLSIKGAPVGSEFVSCYWVHEKQCFAIAVKHESFEDIPDDEELPELKSIITRHPYTPPTISMN